MGKGKGRQSGGFGSKSQRAAFAQEIRQQTQQVKLSRPKPKQNQKLNPTNGERPRFTRLTQLKGILRERQSQEAYVLRERRRRAGFLPQNDATPVLVAEPIVSHPPGWLIHYGTQQSDNRKSKIDSLQTKCVNIMGEYIMEYLEAALDNRSTCLIR